MAAIDPQRVICAVVQSNQLIELLYYGEIEGTGINMSNIPPEWSATLADWTLKDLFPDVKHPDMLEDPVRWEEGWKKDLEEAANRASYFTLDRYKDACADATTAIIDSYL